MNPGFPQQELLDLLQNAVNTDSRIGAAWLEGSFGRGNADRYSDIDLHLLLDESVIDSFRAGAEGWLAALRPLALYRLMFGGSMINALTRDGLRLDIWLHAGKTREIDERKAKVLVDREGALQQGKRPDAPKPEALAAQLEQQIREFWRCIALMPSVLGRGELLVSLIGIGIEIPLLSDVLINGYGIERDSGVKRLNVFLPEGLQRKMEQALEINGLSAASMANAHWRLARIMQEEGRKIAARHNFAYPAELERDVLAYVRDELAQLGVVEAMV